MRNAGPISDHLSIGSWDDLRVALAIAREGSIRRAARSLGVSHSTILRRVDALEGATGVQLFERLRRRHALVGQLGVTTAGMDGPALLGLPTMYLTDESNVRMRQWVGAIPSYQEIVREPAYLERISATLQRWASCPVDGGAEPG